MIAGVTGPIGDDALGENGIRLPERDCWERSKQHLCSSSAALLAGVQRGDCSSHCPRSISELEALCRASLAREVMLDGTAIGPSTNCTVAWLPSPTLWYPKP